MVEGRLRRRKRLVNHGDYFTSIDVDEKIKMLQKISPQERN